MIESAESVARAIDALAFPHWPWLVGALPLVFVAVVAALRSRPRAFAWPPLPQARAAGARRIDAQRIASIAMRGLALVCLAVVFADPVRVHRAPPEPGFGLDIVLVVDASGSMQAIDTRIAGERRSRLDLARRVIARFAEHRVAEGDRVALVVFGEAAFTPCPLTSDGALLANALARVQAGIAGEATALGDALALGVKRATAGASTADATSPLAGRVIVLLTDGQNNAGSIPVEVATELARGEAVRVHTVGIGTSGQEVPVLRSAPAAAGAVEFERHDVDVESLQRIAAATGGRFFAARRSDHLESVYRDIDALERVARRMPPRIRHAPNPEPFLAVAGICLLLELSSARIGRRRIP